MNTLLQEGTVVGGDYRLLEELGTGGMGAVYRAAQISTGSDRALKVFRELKPESKWRRTWQSTPVSTAKGRGR